MEREMRTAILLLRSRPAFWDRVRSQEETGRLVLSILPFLIASTAAYGAVLAGWRSPKLSLYVAVKLPILLMGTTSLVMMLNWLLATILRSGMTFKQVMAVTYGAMGVACWILLSLIPVTLFFTFCVASREGSNTQLRLTHNYILLTHIVLIAFAGVAGNAALRHGIREIVAPECATETLYWSWILAFGFVGCQLSWILRPFVGSPFYDVAFMRPDCLERNFYEFVFTEVLPFVLRGGR